MKVPILAALIACLPAFAIAGGISVRNAYIFEAPPAAKTLAAYLTLANTGAAPRGLVGVRAEGFAMAHLHESREADGIATMTAIQQLDIPPGGEVEFKPGGLHIMLMMPMAPVTVGAEVPLWLEFADGESVPVKAMVVARDLGN